MATSVTYYKKTFIYRAFSVALSVAFSNFLCNIGNTPIFFACCRVAVIFQVCQHFWQHVQTLFGFRVDHIYASTDWVSTL